jgi:trimethylamine:corrinoid methyltransferase-like protein
MGTLNSGGTGSPAQFMLDLEIRKSQFALKDEIAIDEDSLAFAEICEAAAEDKDFLSSEHTLKHCRDLWTSRLFLTENPFSGGWTGDEKGILDSCDAMWRESLKNYEPPQWPEEKRKALKDVVARAKKEFGEG